MAYTQTFQIQPLEPFNFELSAQIFSSGDKEIRGYENGKFHQVLRLNGNLVLICVTSNGKIDQPNLTIEVKSNNPITFNNKTKAKEIVSYIFNLGFGLSSFYEEVEKDPVMKKIVNQLYGLKNPTTPTVFESLVDSIVEQQISIKVAHTIEQRLTKKFGETLTIEGNTYFAYPAPEKIASAGTSEIQQVGLTKRKAEYIHGAAQLIAEGKLDLEGMKDEEDPERIISELDEIKGIGVWTAELTMLRGMQRLDAFPADDFGIRRVISRYYCDGKPIGAAEARKIADAWGRWKGLAAFYLIIAEIKGITV